MKDKDQRTNQEREAGELRRQYAKLAKAGWLTQRFPEAVHFRTVEEALSDPSTVKASALLTASPTCITYSRAGRYAKHTCKKARGQGEGT